MTIREAAPEDAGAIARVHVDTWRTTYPSIMPQAHLDALSYAERERMWAAQLSGNETKPLHVFVAATGTGEIVGFASGGPEKTDDPEYGGEIYALYVLQAQQGQGLGRRLVQPLARRLAEEGYVTLLIWVNAHNPACRFYEALGGEVVRTGKREIKGVVYDDIGYGWNEATFERLLQEKA